MKTSELIEKLIATTVKSGRDDEVLFYISYHAKYILCTIDDVWEENNVVNIEGTPTFPQPYDKG